MEKREPEKRLRLNNNSQLMKPTISVASCQIKPQQQQQHQHQQHQQQLSQGKGKQGTPTRLRLYLSTATCEELEPGRRTEQSAPKIKQWQLIICQSRRVSRGNVGEASLDWFIGHLKTNSPKLVSLSFCLVNAGQHTLRRWFVNGFDVNWRYQMECLMNIEETKIDQSEFGWDICWVIYSKRKKIKKIDEYKE